MEKITYQYSPSGNGELLLTIDGSEIGKVYEKEHAELIEQTFDERISSDIEQKHRVDEINNLYDQIEALEEEKKVLISKYVELLEKAGK
jgi:hypothetical protein